MATNSHGQSMPYPPFGMPSNLLDPLDCSSPSTSGLSLFELETFLALTANLTHVSMSLPVQKFFLGVRSQGSTHATLLSGTSIRGTNTLRTRKNSTVR